MLSYKNKFPVACLSFSMIIATGLSAGDDSCKPLSCMGSTAVNSMQRIANCAFGAYDHTLGCAENLATYLGDKFHAKTVGAYVLPDNHGTRLVAVQAARDLVDNGINVCKGNENSEDHIGDILSNAIGSRLPAVFSKKYDAVMSSPLCNNWLVNSEYAKHAKEGFALGILMRFFGSEDSALTTMKAHVAGVQVVKKLEKVGFNVSKMDVAGYKVDVQRTSQAIAASAYINKSSIFAWMKNKYNSVHLV